MNPGAATDLQLQMGHLPFVVCVAVVLASGTAFGAGVSYTFSGTRFNEIVLSGTTYGAKWDNTANWTPLLGIDSPIEVRFYCSQGEKQMPSQVY
jgi:hypothetical protein